MGAREEHVLAQEIGEIRARCHVDMHGPTIDGERDLHGA
jgi:hypothetical protein